MRRFGYSFSGHYVIGWYQCVRRMVGSRVSDAVRRLSYCREGVVAILTAIALVPLAGVILVVAIDLSNAYAVSSLVQSAVDTASLSGLRLYRELLNDGTTTREQAVAAVKEHAHKIYFRELQATSAVVSDIDLITEVNIATNGSVSITNIGDARVGTYFIQLFNIDAVDVSHRGTATGKPLAADNFEFAIALDISGSLADLSGSGWSRARELTVATGEFVSELFQSRLTLHSPDTGVLLVSLLPFAGSIHFGPRYAHWRKPNNGKWRGCFEFWDEYSDYVSGGPEMPLTIRGIDFDGSHTISYCPNSKHMVKLFHTDEKKLVSYLSQFEITEVQRGVATMEREMLHAGTGLDLAVGWGYRSLSEDMQGEFHIKEVDYIIPATGLHKMVDVPLPYLSNQTSSSGKDIKNHKFLLILTDGNLLIQEHAIGSSILPHRSKWYGDTREGETRFLEICEAAKLSGIKVVVVGFKVNSPNLRRCASPRQYYTVNDAVGLAASLRTVLADVSEIRLVR